MCSLELHQSTTVSGFLQVPEVNTAPEMYFGAGVTLTTIYTLWLLKAKIFIN